MGSGVAASGKKSGIYVDRQTNAQTTLSPAHCGPTGGREYIQINRAKSARADYFLPMNQKLELYRRLLAALAALERSLIVLLILTIVGNIGAQVFSRYVLNDPLIWVEELATYAFIWATFLGAGLGMKHSRHVRIITFVDKLGTVGGTFVRSLVHFGILTLTIVLIRQAWTVVEVESRRSSISLPVELPISLFFSVPLIFGAASIALTTVYLIADDIAAAATGRARRPIVSPETV